MSIEEITIESNNTCGQSFFFFLNQQFITWDMRADHGSYFVTMYKKSKLYESKNRKERNKEQEEKKRKRNDRKMK